MEDSVEVRRRIDRLVARVERRDDYGRLLADGQVFRETAALGQPAEEWRAGLRRQARADRIKVRTGLRGSHVWAMVDRSPSEMELIDVGRRMVLTDDVIREARDLSHRPAVVMTDGQEALLRCKRCAAPGYLDAASDRFVGGELFELICDEPSSS